MRSLSAVPGRVALPGWAVRLVGALLPWFAFASILAWSWGVRDLTASVPNYGDSLEVVSGITWFGQAVSTGQNPLIYPLNYFPEGWRVATHGGGPILFVVLWPLALLGGAALAFNVAALAAHALAFGGALALARRYLGSLPAMVAALAFTFWGLRWNQGAAGRLNILVGSALLPWLAYAFERSLEAERRPWRWLAWRWLALAAVLWAATIMVSLYFAFIGGLVLLVWGLLCRPAAVRPWARRILYLAFTAFGALVVAAPWLYLNGRETRLADPPFYSIYDLNFWGASLNALFAPYTLHPWLSGLAQQIYQGPPTWEQATANLGLVTFVCAVAGAFLARRDRAWRPAVWLAVAGLVLSLGLTLHWSSQPVQWPLLRPLNQALWRIGHLFKPAFFFGLEPPVPLADGVPLPGLLLTAVAPFAERGRLMARYALAGSLGVYLLAGLAIARLRRPWLQGLLACLVVLELLPPRLDSLPYPPAGHPAFTWLGQQSIPGEGIAEVVAAHESSLVLGMSGDILLATFYHHQASVTGASGVAPRSQAALYDWFVKHPHPFWHPDFAAAMRAFHVRYLSMIMLGDWDRQLWQEARANPELKRLSCYPPPEGPSPWPWELCLVEVLPAAPSNVNVMLHDGFSGKEDWGVWAEGTESYAQWLAPSRVSYRLSWSVFPLCLPGRTQAVALSVNGRLLQTHEWHDCEPWRGTADVPADLVRAGENDLLVQAAYAENPPASPGAAPDPRRLSVGFSQLTVEPAR